MDTPKGVLGYRRQEGDEVTSVYLNFTGKSIDVPVLKNSETAIIDKVHFDSSFATEKAHSQRIGLLSGFQALILGN